MLTDPDHSPNLPRAAAALPTLICIMLDLLSLTAQAAQLPLNINMRAPPDSIQVCVFISHSKTVLISTSCVAILDRAT